MNELPDFEHDILKWADQARKRGLTAVECELVAAYTARRHDPTFVLADHVASDHVYEIADRVTLTLITAESELTSDDLARLEQLVKERFR